MGTDFGKGARMKIWQKIVIVLSLLVCIGGALAYDAFYTAPKRYSVRYETLSSIYIPAQLNDVNILFFSDLDYGVFMDEQRLSKLVDTINSLSPDVVIFGGDLYDRQAGEITDDMKATVSSYLKKITAPLGKFSVLGEMDYLSQDRLTAVRQVLYDSDFEVLVNTSVNLRNGGSQAVSLIGLDSGLNGYTDIDAAYANVSRTAYAIAICHTPDTAAEVPADITKYFLAGHSHGGQVYYFFGAMYTPEMATQYLRGKHSVNGKFTLDITNGVGTTEKDIRFLANAEVVLYRLQHKTVSDAQ